MDGTTLRFGELELDLGRRELRRAGALVELQRTPLAVLLYLGEHRDRTVPRQELLDAIWPDAVVVEETLTRALTEVRRAVGDQGDAQRVIRTHKGVGYRFVAAVDVIRDAEANTADTQADAKRVRTRNGVRPRFGLPRALVVLVAGALASLAAAAWLRAPSDAAHTSPPYGIAVLPIAHLGSHAADRELADGLTEQITHALAQNGYPVVARTTAAQWRERAADVRALGRELGISHVLEGSVRRGTGRVRVTLQLVTTDDGKHVWSETFDASESDPLATQDRITQLAAAQMQRLVWEDAEAMKGEPRLAELSELVVESRRLFLGARWQDQLAVSERVLALAPQREAFFLRGATHALMSMSWANDYAYGRKPFSEAGPKLLAHAEQAVALAPHDAFAHVALSRAYAHHWRWAEAEREMRRTCELDPRGFACGGILAHVCAALGCIEEQLEGARWRVRAMPADPGSWVTLGWALANNNRREEAAAAEQRIRELGAAAALALLPRASWRLGRRDAAVAEGAQILRALGSDAGALELERRGAASVEDAWRWLAELQAATWHAGIPNLHELIAARTYAELGDMDAALAALERSVASHEAGMELFGLDPIFDPIRDTPRFRALIEIMGLAPYHAKYAQPRPPAPAP